MTQVMINQAFQAALQHHHAGRLADAEAIYRQILTQEPRHADSLQLLGAIAIQVERYEAAVELIRQSLAISPRNTVALGNLGLAYARMSRWNEARQTLEQALAVKPDYLEALYNLGLVYAQLQQPDVALAFFERTLDLQPQYADAWIDRGAVLCSQNRWQEGIICYERALALAPQQGRLHHKYGLALQHVERASEAISAFRRALACSPNLIEAWNDLGDLLANNKQIEEAIRCFRKALEINPNYAPAQNNLGNTYRDLGRLAEALEAYERALKINANYPQIYNNMGTVQADLGRYEEAIVSYRKALSLPPDFPEIRCAYALTLLLMGNFAEGWVQYEARRRCMSYPDSRRNYGKPQWDGRPLEGRPILLHAEQGLGDSIHFIRYAPLVAQRGGKVYVEIQAELYRLFQQIPGIARLIKRADPLPDYDFECPFLSLPKAFGTHLENMPADVPYLRADPALSRAWKQRMAGEAAGLKVGVVWAGSPEHKNDRNRSISPSLLWPLTQIAGVRFYSLQKGAAPGQLEALRALTPLVDWTQELSDFADTTALVDNLDLVVTADTAVAHLAGAMGKPVWVFVPFSPDWRWLLNREDTPWYPTMRLFRQPALGDWPSVIERVAAALAARAAG